MTCPEGHDLKAEREQAWSLIKQHGYQTHVFPVLTVLQKQKSRVYETIDTIYTSISHQKSDLQDCLPKLSEELRDMLGNHFYSIQVQIIKLGREHPVVKDLGQEHDQMIDDANRALSLCNQVLHHLDDLFVEDTESEATGTTRQNA
jgi:hypothetical protein